MSKIYTKRGDKGKTGLSGGVRVDKDSPKIECNGTIDEANSQLGLLRVKLGAEHKWQKNLYRIQMDIMEMMKLIARPDYSEKRVISDNLTNGSVFMEEWMISLESEMKSSSDYFILPGGNEVSALCHLVRTMIRRAERRLTTVMKLEDIEAPIPAYLNRMSDLFFILARAEMDANNVDEEIWRSFRKKKK